MIMYIYVHNNQLIKTFVWGKMCY